MNLLTTFGAAVYGAATISMGGHFVMASTVSPSTPKHTVKKAAITATVQPTVSAPPVSTPQPNLITVQEGDTLTSIAATNNTTYVRLFDANTNIADPDIIFPGQVISIPTATEQLTPRTLPDPTPAPVSDTTDSTLETTDTTAATVTTPAPVVTSAPVASAPTQVVTSSGNGVWDELAACESGGNWAIDTGNGFYGGLQFTLASWQAVGGTGYPNQASPQEQIARAEILQARQGWGAWPACTAKLGIN